MTRVVNCKTCHEWDVYIGRWGPNTPRGKVDFGNLWAHKPGCALFKVRTVEEAIRCHDRWLHAEPEFVNVQPERRLQVVQAIPSLAGKRLACWCKPGPCHGDTLARIANSLPELTGIIQRLVTLRQWPLQRW